METDIRPVIWLAKFLKTKKNLYDTTKWPDFACAVYFSTKKLIFLMKKMGLHAGKHYSNNHLQAVVADVATSA